MPSNLLLPLPHVASMSWVSSPAHWVGAAQQCKQQTVFVGCVGSSHPSQVIQEGLPSPAALLLLCQLCFSSATLEKVTYMEHKFCISACRLACNSRAWYKKHHLHITWARPQGHLLLTVPELWHRWLGAPSLGPRQRQGAPVQELRVTTAYTTQMETAQCCHEAKGVPTPMLCWCSSPLQHYCRTRTCWSSAGASCRLSHALTTHIFKEKPSRHLKMLCKVKPYLKTLTEEWNSDAHALTDAHTTLHSASWLIQITDSCPVWKGWWQK